MNIGNLLIMVILCYYIIYILTLCFSVEKKLKTFDRNVELDKLRLIQHKTLEEQKNFLDLKEPKETWHFSWLWLWCTFLQLCIYVTVYYTLYKILDYYNIESPLWLGITFLIGLPILMNFILKKFNMNN